MTTVLILDLAICYLLVFVFSSPWTALMTDYSLNLDYISVLKLPAMGSELWPDSALFLSCPMKFSSTSDLNFT